MTTTTTDPATGPDRRRWRSLDAPSARPATADRPSRCPDDEQANPGQPPAAPTEVKGSDVPGWEGTTGPGPRQYGRLHVYARDVHSGAGNCVCGRHPTHALHVPTPFAPGGYPGKVT